MSTGIVNGGSFIYDSLMPRPRTTSDEQILEATHRVIARIGPNELTLAAVGQEAGLSAATLVQRFGSKRGLLLALAKMSATSVGECFAAIRSAHSSPLAALIAAATEMARHVTSAEELANGLAFFQMDINDPEFHQLALENDNSIQAGYRRLINDAIAAGEMVGCDPRSLARSVSALAWGSLLAWAIHRTGKAETWVRNDLTTLIEPYLAKKRQSTGRRRPRP